MGNMEYVYMLLLHTLHACTVHVTMGLCPHTSNFKEGYKSNSHIHKITKTEETHVP